MIFFRPCLSFFPFYKVTQLVLNCCVTNTTPSISLISVLAGRHSFTCMLYHLKFSFSALHWWSAALLWFSFSHKRVSTGSKLYIHLLSLLVTFPYPGLQIILFLISFLWHFASFRFAVHVIAVVFHFAGTFSFLTVLNFTTKMTKFTDCFWVSDIIWNLLSKLVHLPHTVLNFGIEWHYQICLRKNQFCELNLLG